jgi:hypothetical protein
VIVWALPRPALTTPKLEKPTDNVKPMRLPASGPPEQDQELQKLYEAVVAKTEEAIRWYDRHKGHHKRRAVLFRGSAVVLAGLASIVPIAVSMFPLEWQPQRWVPVASILAALSASCIGLDRLYGFSSNWMRYLTALLELQSHLEVLQFSWARRALESRLLGPTNKEENLAASLNQLQATLTSVNQALRTETLEWITHFSGALQELDKSVSAQRSAALTPLALPPPTQGALKVQLVGLEALDDHRYEFFLDDASQGEYASVTKAFTGLTPVQHLLRVTAKRGGKPVSVEDVVTIKPGETTAVTVTLA